LFRLGLIGAGRWGRNYIKTINSLCGFELRYLVSRNPDSSSLVESKCRIHTNVESILEQKDLDGVIVALPPNLQPQIAVDLISAGFPVLIQKPLALNLKDALMIQRISKDRGLIVLVDHTYLFHPAFELLKKQVRDNKKIMSIYSMGWNWGPFRKEVDVLWDWLPHDIAMSLWILKEYPKFIDVNQLEILESPSKEGKIFNIQLEFPSGCIAEITVGNIRTPRKRYFKVKMSKKVLVFDDCANQKLILNKNGNIVPLNVPKEMPLDRVLKTFSKGINGKLDDRFGLGLSVDVVRLITEIDHLLLSKQNASKN